MDTHTSLYCIFGNPVTHSKSPLIHNTWFDFYKLNNAYLAFEIKDISEGVCALKTLNIRGASVTIPFKESVMDHLDVISQDAVEIGAVNTIVNRDGRLYGYNTDCMAAISPLKPYGIKDKTVMIIGAGGAARAVAYGIKKEGGSIIIANRSRDKGEKLAAKFDGEFIGLDALKHKKKIFADIIINTTSIGMHPHVDDTPVDPGVLTSSMIVMDVVYTPLNTRLLNNAGQKGARAIDGLSMFLHQGAAQFDLWTGITPDIETVRPALTDGDR